jgi:alpha-glucosidase
MRSIDRFPFRSNREEKAKVAATLLLTLQGTPFIYYGQEIGMHNTHIPRSQIRDPLGKRFWPLFSGRDAARSPMQWDHTKPGCGFTTGKPWLPLNRDYRTRNVRQQEGNPDSLLNHYRRLISWRKSSEALQTGSWTPVANGKDGILAYFRTTKAESVIVVLNFTGKTKHFSLPGHNYGSVLHSTHRSAGEYSYFRNMQIIPFEATAWLVVE